VGGSEVSEESEFIGVFSPLLRGTLLFSLCYDTPMVEDPLLERPAMKGGCVVGGGVRYCIKRGMENTNSALMDGVLHIYLTRSFTHYIYL